MIDQSKKDLSHIPCATLKEPEAARYIGMSVPFLRISRMDGERAKRTAGPPFIKIGKAVRYRIEDLDAWLLSNRRGSA